MTTTSTGSATTTTTPVSAGMRVGLVLSALLGAANFPFLFDPNSLGSATQSPPPYWLLVINAVLGLVSIVAAVLAWRSGNRMLIRINAAALIINAVTDLPGFFLRTTAGIKALTAVVVLATVVAVVLMLRRDRGPVAVTD
jgi:hypothetical protein